MVNENWRDDFMNKNTGSSPKGAVFDYQHSDGHSQLK